MPRSVWRRRQADLRLLLDLGFNVAQSKELLAMSSPTLGDWTAAYDLHDALVRIVRWEKDCKISLRREILLSDNNGILLIGESEELEEFLLRKIFQFIAEETDLLALPCKGGNLLKKVKGQYNLGSPPTGGEPWLHCRSRKDTSNDTTPHHGWCGRKIKDVYSNGWVSCPARSANPSVYKLSCSLLRMLPNL